jgi:biotin carboxylase
LAAITVNYVANALGLPANSPRTARIATNKYEMRRAFHAAGIATPAFCKVGPGEDTKAIRAMELPVIVKPTDRSGSRGITKLVSFDGLERAIDASAAESFEHKAIVEEYIEGDEFSCECVSSRGAHHLLAVTKKFTTGAPHFIETAHLEPAPLSTDQMKVIRHDVFAALDALEISCGASHSEFKLGTDGRVRIIEIGARMGGDCIGSDLVLLSTGHDFVKMTLQAALGEDLDLSVCRTPKTAAIKFIFSPEDVVHLRILQKEHPEKIWRVSGIESFDHPVVDSSSRYGFYIVACESREEAMEFLEL